MSTVRFDGLYHYNELWLRFWPDNVVEARFVDNDPSPAAAAHLVAPGNSGFGPGRYQLNGQAIEVDINFPSGPNHYSGLVGKDLMKLTYVAEGTNNPERTYVFHPLSEAELAPGPAARIHHLRDKLKSKDIDVAVVGAAAALGDQMAILAFNPVDFEVTAKRLAALGPQACLRVLLAMCWTDDGQWYYPIQSNGTDGSRKCDEGKLLRALAQWCIKSDDKTLAKVKEAFAEMSRIGPDFEFMDMVMHILLAPNEVDRAKPMKEALAFHIDQDALAAYESAQAQVVPWLLYADDPLAAKLKRIK